jgi:glycolate oxidase iron-sulfur subunit
MGEDQFEMSSGGVGATRSVAMTIATANPGCMTQLEAGLRQRGIDGRVVHVIELLDAAMAAGE